MRYFEFDVTLRYVEPPPWRRLQLPADASFSELHSAIQDACGWQRAHLYTFQDAQGEALAGIPHDEWGEPDPDATQVRLSAFFPSGGTCTYLYDFGDSWEHDVALVREFEGPERFHRRLVAGERAFPPEDCGGVPGYEQCVRVAAGGDDPDDLREWLGAWHPEDFDLDAARARFDH